MQPIIALLKKATKPISYVEVVVALMIFAMNGADLSNSNLTATTLLGAGLRGANLSGANLIETNLSRVKYDDKTKLKVGFSSERAGAEYREAIWDEEANADGQ